MLPAGRASLEGDGNSNGNPDRQPRIAPEADPTRQSRAASRGRRIARELLIVAFGLPLITLVVLLVLIVATLLLAGSDIGGLTGTLGAAWLAVHQVPISLSGVTIGALPMLPTLLVVAGTAAVVRSAGRDREVRELGAIAAAAVGGPLVFTAMAVAVVMDGASTSQIQSPDALSAFAYTLLVHAVGAGVGVGTTSREPLRRHVAVSAADRTGLRFGVVALFALLAAGGVVVTVRLILNWDQLGPCSPAVTTSTATSAWARCPCCIFPTSSSARPRSGGRECAGRNRFRRPDDGHRRRCHHCPRWPRCPPTVWAPSVRSASRCPR